MLLIRRLVPRLLVRRLGAAVLTTDSAQRLRIGRSLLAAALYVCCLGVMIFAVTLDAPDPRIVRFGMVYILSGPVVFYALMRTGWNRRLAEPAMTLAQMLFAVSALMLSYAICTPVRAALLLILTQVMAFGMFSLTPIESRRLMAFSIGGFGATMGLLAALRPAINDPHLELINFLALTTVLLVVTSLSSQFARLRTRLRRQRAELAETFVRLETLVRRDELTGLVNRRHMQEVLADEQLRRARHLAPACLCAIDLDHFKRVNDNFGHAAGDEVLKRFATVASGCLRQIDVLARWGGEEFLLLLPQTDAGDVLPLLERLRAALADAACWQDAPEWRVTFSAGVTLWRPSESPEPAIERADRAAYRAKASGRDGWCFA